MLGLYLEAGLAKELVSCRCVQLVPHICAAWTTSEILLIVWSAFLVNKTKQTTQKIGVLKQALPYPYDPVS